MALNFYLDKKRGRGGGKQEAGVREEGRNMENKDNESAIFNYQKSIRKLK